MQEAEITWWRVFRIYWLFMWRATLGATVFGFIIGFVFGLVGYFVGFHPDEFRIVTIALGFVGGMAWSVVVLKMAIKKRYSDFQIVLVPAASTEF